MNAALDACKRTERRVWKNDQSLVVDHSARKRGKYVVLAGERLHQNTPEATNRLIEFSTLFSVLPPVVPVRFAIVLHPIGLNLRLNNRHQFGPFSRLLLGYLA